MPQIGKQAKASIVIVYIMKPFAATEGENYVILPRFYE